MVRGAVLAVAVLLGAAALGGTSAAAGSGGGSRSSGGEPAPEPTLRTRVEELQRLAAPVPLPADRAPRFAFVGDSVAATLAPALVAEARGRGAGASQNTRPGCGLLPGLPTTLDGYIPPWTRACESEVPTWQRQIAASPADVVVVLSTWDGSPRTLDGAFLDPGTVTGRQSVVDLFRQLVDTIAPPGSGRSVVFLAEAIPAPGAVTGDASPTRINEARQHRSSLRAVARALPDRVRVIDLGQWLCPNGPQCPPSVEGVVTRADDGGHFTADGAAWLAPRLLDALGVPAS
jgi:hypothetical protein